MRTLGTILLTFGTIGWLGSAGTSEVRAQYPGYPAAYPGYPIYPGYGAMTPAMGAGIGYGQALAGQGAYNLANAQAAEIQDRAARQYLQNQNVAVNQFYQNKQLHQQYENKIDQPPSPHDMHYMAAAAAPHRLTADQFDRMHDIIIWPYELRVPEFDKLRYQIDRLFSDRTPQNSGEASSNYTAIVNACQEMETVLRTHVDRLAPMAFIQAQQFIKSVAYEANFPLQVRQTSANVYENRSERPTASANQPAAPAPAR
ncbi:MAG TPA: hypothetical protein VHV55_13605 [Pirellulales bacterium]|jgi:hypothetical protein|nr:hypothetical protein [Pirellulales bacterium]